MSVFVKNYFMPFVFVIFFISLGVIVFMPPKTQEKAGLETKTEMPEPNSVSDIATDDWIAADPPSVFPTMVSLEFVPESTLSDPILPFANDEQSELKDSEQSLAEPCPSKDKEEVAEIASETMPEPVEESTKVVAQSGWVPFIYVYEKPLRGNAFAKISIFPIMPQHFAEKTKVAQVSPSETATTPMPAKMPLNRSPLLPVMYGPMRVKNVTPTLPMYPIYRPRMAPTMPIWVF